MEISFESADNNFSYESNGNKTKINIVDILGIKPKPEICTDGLIELFEQLDSSINELYMESGNKSLYDIRVELLILKQKLKEIK
jgi:hypothetical protein